MRKIVKNSFCLIALVCCIILVSCGGSSVEERAKKINDSIDSVKKVTDSLARIEKSFPKSLIIKGTNVNMRVSPDLKAVKIKQLKTNDSCEVLEKGKKQTIDDNTDYWYKVRYKNKEGWIFGAYTSAKQPDKSEDLDQPKTFAPTKK